MKRRNKVPAAIMDLPTDLIAGIFARIPLKYTLISKRVCKSGYNLISNPDFTRACAKLSPFTTIFLTKDSKFRPMSFSLLEFSGDGEFTELPVKPKLSDLKTDSDLGIIGFCNDYIFFVRRISCYDDGPDIRKVYLCNPLGGTCVEALEYRITESTSSDESVVCKVGYIPSTDTYKLLRLCFRVSKVGGAEIFTVGSEDRSWRALDGPLEFWDYPCPVLVCFNGVFHWATADGICTFDLLEEKSGPRVSLPSVYSRGGLTSFGLDMRVVVYKDRLSLVENAVVSEIVEIVIWTMKEYGVRESWSLDVVLKVSSPDPLDFGFKDIFPIALLPNGYLMNPGKFAKHWGFLMFYSFEKKGLVWIKVSDYYEISYTQGEPNMDAKSFMY